MRPHVRSPLDGPYGATASHDGISFQASTGRVVIKAPGAAPTVTTLTSAFTFTGGNQSMYRGPSGLLIASATNTPRIEYGSGGDVLGLLMEASRTNLALQSADFATSWITSLATVSANTITDPAGTTTADKIVESSGGTFHLVRQDVAIAANTPHTFSIWAVAAGRTFCRVQFSDNTETNGAFVDVNLTTGATGAVTTFGTGSAASVVMSQYAGGLWRIQLTCTVDAASVTGRMQILLASALGTVNYAGDGASGIGLYGAQLEAAKFASSYIPTTTVSVARTADSCIRTLSTEFSATAGTVVVAGRTSGGQDATLGQVIAEFNDGTGNERHTITRAAATDSQRYNMFDGGALQSSLDGGAFGNLTMFKLGAAWALNDVAASFNGAAVVTDSAATLPTVTQLGLASPSGAGGMAMNGHIRTFDYYPTRQPNEWLVARAT